MTVEQKKKDPRALFGWFRNSRLCLLFLSKNYPCDMLSLSLIPTLGTSSGEFVPGTLRKCPISLSSAYIFSCGEFQDLLQKFPLEFCYFLWIPKPSPRNPKWLLLGVHRLQPLKPAAEHTWDLMRLSLKTPGTLFGHQETRCGTSRKFCWESPKTHAAEIYVSPLWVIIIGFKEKTTKICSRRTKNLHF